MFVCLFEFKHTNCGAGALNKHAVTASIRLASKKLHVEWEQHASNPVSRTAGSYHRGVWRKALHSWEYTGLHWTFTVGALDWDLRTFCVLSSFVINWKQLGWAAKVQPPLNVCLFTLCETCFSVGGLQKYSMPLNVRSFSLYETCFTVWDWFEICTGAIYANLNFFKKEKARKIFLSL